MSVSQELRSSFFTEPNDFLLAQKEAKTWGQASPRGESPPARLGCLCAEQNSCSACQDVRSSLLRWLQIAPIPPPNCATSRSLYNCGGFYVE